MPMTDSGFHSAVVLALCLSALFLSMYFFLEALLSRNEIEHKLDVDAIAWAQLIFAGLAATSVIVGCVVVVYGHFSQSDVREHVQAMRKKSMHAAQAGSVVVK